VLFRSLDRVYTRYDNGGADATATALSERGIGGGRADRRCTFTTIKDEGLGSHGPAWILVRAPCSWSVEVFDLSRFLHPAGRLLPSWCVLPNSRFGFQAAARL